MAELFPSCARFEELATQFNRVPLVATLICDEMTPVSAFARLQVDRPRAFLLESVVGGENVARYSFLGVDPQRTFATRRDEVRWIDHATGAARTERTNDPLAVLEQHLREYRTPVLPGLPRFLGGAVGYAAYDTVRYYERLPHAPADDRGLPDLLFDVYETLVVFDHVRKVTLVVAHAAIPPDADGAARRTAYDEAARRIDEVIARLGRPSALHPVQVTLPAAPVTRYTSNFTQAEFERVVERCQEYIRAGDIFQVVPSQRLLVETSADPLDVYRALRVINPSPFMFYLKSPEVTLVGASPEVMCRVQDGVVMNRPLAGTRRRGATDEEDRRLREELLADPKERAEHVMLVDLGRNDVGRVARPGSVRISSVMDVEYYSHVMHISSTVTGELAEGRTAFDALRAALPVGTVSGAPKVRALEIIDECEPTRRGPYAGAVGYVDFAGNMDTCIALRTLVMHPGGGAWRAYIQAGAGIVADSVPEREYQETLNKAQSLLSAIGLAEARFGA
ncbi:MAG: anthranilate synthase component I [Phycisphaerae bacterium]|nr:anthranilate synthase component I [Phycisphaerae bacterium]